ncbi:hypothetical protein INS49_004491 [Diaporthe citri]|uniref:uncharacterized protein n=1 Tax=Diaporthe citri TaxID=83186 RepID=UPI001C80D63D|nr:uncharacterized protein INS49_004491 [Diaporthe citri]KAG6354474.1 hypothetical protein INS49_004491 [Diaporthe citri]
MGSAFPLKDTFAAERPGFDDLPLRKGGPKASAWGLWGDDDELGTLNLLTPSIVKAAAAEVVTGETVALKKLADIAKKTITGRGVLLDWQSWATEQGIQIDHFASHGIPLSQLQAVAAAQLVQVRRGDVLLVGTGWLPAYNALSQEQKAALPHRPVRSSCGVEASENAIRWHWDNALAAVASDAVAYEAWPSPRLWGISMHEVFLSGLEMPIGESFDLEELSVKCREAQRWSFMFVGVPLDVPGGVANPPGAVAIF